MKITFCMDIHRPSLEKQGINKGKKEVIARNFMIPSRSNGARHHPGEFGGRQGRRCLNAMGGI